MSKHRENRCVPKLVGADFELGNFILGRERASGTGADASKALLAEIDGVEASRSGAYSYGRGSYWVSASPWSQDRGRKYLPTNGACAYIDLDHAEMAIPEVLSAFDHAAASMAMLRIARRAQVRANAGLPDGESLQVTANTSDGKGHSYGSHLNFLVSRAVWDDIFERRPHYLLFLASHQLSSIVFCGQGKVGSENGRPEVAYQISQRADFFETVVGTQTTYNRPIVNSRDEALCDAERHLARLHVIWFDQTLCSAASVLKVGAMQLVLAMLEAEDIDVRLSVDEPVAAATAWSHDPLVRTGVRLVDGSNATAVELQQRILEKALRHRETHGFATVPRADEILALWQDTLEKLAARDFDALTGRIDWVLKLRLLERALEENSELSWSSPQIKLLDQLYASLDPEDGLFWPCAASGLVEPWIEEEAIARFEHEPPEDTRAWTRAMLLRRFGREEIEKIDWDQVTLLVEEDGYRRRVEVRLGNPLAFTRKETAHLFERSAVEWRTQ